MTKTTAEEALERAQAVAARLRGDLPGVLNHPAPAPPAATAGAAGATTTKSKRRRWGLAPTAEEQQQQQQQQDSVTITSGSTFTEINNNKRLRPDLSFLTTAAAATATSAAAAAAAAPTTTFTFKRLWITTTKERPAAHFVQYLSDKFPTLEEQILAALPNPPTITADKKEENDTDADDKKDNNESIVGFSMQLEGRGSGGKPPTPGMPLEPLHVYLTGTAQQIQMAEPLVDILLQDAEEAPVDEAIRIQQQLQNRDNDLLDAQLLEQDIKDESTWSRALVALSSSTTLVDPISVRRANTNVTYRPASVAQMIGQIGQGGGGDHDNGSGAGAGAGGDDWIQEEVQVPTGVIGFIIGRGGENISRMQIRTGAKIQIQQRDSELLPGQTHRKIQLSAPPHKADAIAQVKEWIEKVVAEKSGGSSGSGGPGGGGGPGGANGSNSNANRGAGAGGGGPGIGFNGGGGGGGGISADKKDSRIQEAIAAGHVHLQVQVPDADVGLVIGRQGATIKSLQERTGANIQVPPASASAAAEVNAGMRIVNITHPTAEGAQVAKSLIENMIAERQQQKAAAATAALDTSNSSSHMGAAAGPGHSAAAAAAGTVSVQILIPDKDVGLCIGRQGCVIRHMQAASQARIQIPQHCTPAPNDPYNLQPPTRVATIVGSPEGCAMVQQMIGRIIAEQSSAGVMGNHSTHHGGGGGWQQQQNHQSSYQQQQPQPSQGQQGYSAEWAAYHAAQQQAAAQQQQQQQAAVVVPQQSTTVASAAAPAPATTTATAGGQPAADAYYEEFHRYSYYYGETAARNHYGAWAPPEGTPNPYGVNPSGIQPAPQPSTASATATTTVAAATTTATSASAPAVPAASTAAAASAPVSDARETSRRKVSNLPAWMTKS